MSSDVICYLYKDTRLLVAFLTGDYLIWFRLFAIKSKTRPGQAGLMPHVRSIQSYFLQTEKKQNVLSVGKCVK